MKNILILGAGFAGLRTALKLENMLTKLHDDWSIVLVDRNSYHTHTPALYEVASAYYPKARARSLGGEFDGLLGSAVCLSIQSILLGKNIIFVEQEVKGIDFKEKLVRTGEGDAIPFEYLVIAIGSESIYFNVKGAQVCCYPLKSLSDALRIRSRIEEIFRSGSANSKEIEVVVVGGGASGVEMVAEIATYTRHLARDYKVGDERVRVLLLEAQDKILAQAEGPSERAKAEQRLKRLGVDIRTGQRISEVTPTCIVLEGGEKCESSMTIWAGGVQGPSLFRKFQDAQLDARGRMIVDAHLQAQGHSRIFAIGDSSSFFDGKTGGNAPATAFIAEQQADIAAKNIIAAIQGRPMDEYRVSIPGYAISCGGKYAIISMFGITFSGFFGWLVKKVIDLRYFLSLLPFRQAFLLLLKELRVFTKND